VEVLVGEGGGRKDAVTRRVTGRAADNRLVHVTVPPGDTGEGGPRPGDLVRARVTHGAPHHLVADGALGDGRWSVRRTRAGDAWERRQAAADRPTIEAAPAGRSVVSLGLPTRRG
jgi:tRNA-2-methylthio-N6-dimethylallyladenosine synthase